MQRVLLVFTLGMFGCADEGEGDASSSGGSTGGDTSSGGQGGDSVGGSTLDEPATTRGEDSSSSTTGSSTSTGGAQEGSSTSGAAAVIGFAEIQADLENVDGAQGSYPSCIDGVPCHNNPDRNVVLVADPTPQQLMQNYQNILDAPGVPWVTPLDDSAQMLNEVPVPDDVRARWLAWIQAGAPFE
jgi:hypothetical protein